MESYDAYIAALRQPFIKLCRLRFLNPDGSTAFAVDNNPLNYRSGAFIASGNINMNWQNGRRRSADVTLANADGAFDYNVNNVWFGSEIALDEGLILPDGTDFYIQQGIFLIETPDETLRPNERTITYHLADKVANLDGALLGNLEGTYEVPYGTNIFNPISALLSEDRGNGLPLDRMTPVFTSWYNGKTQTLPDGTTVLLTDTPDTITVNTGTKWDVISLLCSVLNAWVGYDESGALRVDPSQDDIADADKPIAWRFSMNEAQILGAAYQALNTEVFNDYIVVGEQLSSNAQPSGRAENYDPASDTNIQTIGRKTYYESASGYWTDKQCVDKANWMLKRVSVLQKTVSISCSQMFHLRGNELVTIVRTDKPGAPEERHLVMGFSRPLTGTQPMTIDAVSVADLPFSDLSSGGKLSPRLTLSPSYLSIQAARSGNTTASWLGDGVLSAASSDTGVATVTVSGDVITVTGVSVGSAYIAVSVAETATYSAQTVNLTVAVGESMMLIIPSQSGTLTYTEASQSPTWNDYDSSKMTIGGTTSGTEAGDYSATFTPMPGYYWSDGTTAAKNVTWTIGTALVYVIPTQAAALTYDGTGQSPTWSGYDPSIMTIGGTTSGTDAGDYSATFTMDANHDWGV